MSLTQRIMSYILPSAKPAETMYGYTCSLAYTSKNWRTHTQAVRSAVGEVSGHTFSARVALIVVIVAFLTAFRTR